MSIAPGTASAIASVDALNRPPGFVNLHPEVSINYQLNLGHSQPRQCLLGRLPGEKAAAPDAAAVPV